MNAQPGLRERKKQRTREAIVRAAQQLFVERGYHGTTLPDIAEAADVSTRTIFGYFASKEDILFADLDQQQAALACAVADRPAGSDTLEAVREFILSTRRADRSELDEQLTVLTSRDPNLRSLRRARLTQVVEVLAPAIAEDLRAAPDDPRTQLVIASLAAGFGLLIDRGAAKTRRLTPREIAAQIDPVITFVRAGLDALKDAGTSQRTGRRES
jgi:AcrR family transcriptional regulator